MKIAIFGNTNNYPLRLALALRKLGVEIRLIVNEKYTLHRPEGVAPHYNGRYPEWMVDHADIAIDDYVAPTERIAPVLLTLEWADALILNHLGPSLLAFVPRPAIALLTGSDLDYFGDFATIDERRAVYAPAYAASAAGRLHDRLWYGLIKRQREGIRNATAVSYFHRGLNPEGDLLLDEIGVTDSRRFYLYMAEEVCETWKAPPVRAMPRIFCGTRLTWVRPISPGSSSLDYKGTDIMIRGLAHYIRESGRRLEIRLVRKGTHVRETGALISELGLDGLVTWLDELPAYRFKEEVRQADICIDQLGTTSCVGMAGLSAMAEGRPLIANWRPEIWDRVLGQRSPVCQASTPEDVSEHLRRLVSSKALRETIGRHSRQFVDAQFSPEAAGNECLRRFKTSKQSSGLFTTIERLIDVFGKVRKS